jgi:lipopolysaccharide biosynthesis regulator YciM
VNLELQWLLIGLPVVFALGWLAARFDLRQLKRERSDNPRAYFKGLNLLLNEQQDKAIDAFIEAVQNDPDTAELHFALGNLFRRRGEFERAVRVHQHLLQRGDLKSGDHDRAQHALAQDFMKAGLFDRAEAAYRALEGTAFDRESRLALLSLYERSREWSRAATVAAALEQSGAGSFASRVAHYECEQAQEADAQGHADQAQAALDRAGAAAPQSPRPLLLAGQRHFKAGAAAQALQVWDTLLREHPGQFLLVASDYARAALASDQAAAARETLNTLFAHQPAIELLQALQLLDGEQDSGMTLARLREHLAAHPSLTAADLLVAQPPAAWGDDGLAALRHAVSRAARPLQRYRCAACGFEAQHYHWQCPGCLSWDSYPTQRIDAL